MAQEGGIQDRIDTERERRILLDLDPREDENRERYESQRVSTRPTMSPES